MSAYLYSERLKNKRSFSGKLIFAAPVVTVLLAFLMGGSYNLQGMSIYWWYAFILCGFNAIVCGLSVQREQRAGKFYSVYAQPINLTKFWTAKILFAASTVLFASIFLGLLICLFSALGMAVTAISPLRIMLGCIVVVLAFLWQIPLCMWLAKAFGLFVPMIINTLLGLFSTFITTKPYWWLIPYTWASKICEPITGIKSSGDMGVLADYSMAVVPAILVLSFVLFALLSFLSARWFSRQEVK